MTPVRAPPPSSGPGATDRGASHAAPTSSQASVGYTTSRRPLLRFESHDAFDLAVQANLRSAAASGQPLILPAAAQRFAGYSRFAPTEELALADAALRVVIADTTYQLTAVDGSVRAHLSDASGKIVQVVEASAPSAGKLPWGSGDARGCFYYGEVPRHGGGSVFVRAIFDHTAYRDWTRLRMIAATEIQHRTSAPPHPSCDDPRNDQGYSDTLASYFPNAIVRTEVRGVDENQCMGAFGEFRSSWGPSSLRIYAEARRSRGPNTPVHWSRHEHTVTGSALTTSFLDGSGSGC